MTHNQILTSLNAVFADAAWTSENITTVPASYTGNIRGNKETVRVNIIQLGSDLFYNGDRIKGKIVCNIFVPVTSGENRATQIADILDTLFKKKTISGIQLTNSLIKQTGIDRHKKSLYVVDYEIDFTTIN